MGVPTMLKDQRGALWLGLYGQGLAKLQGGKLTLYQEQNGLAHDQVMALLEDREGNIWVGTQGGGVSKFAGERFVNYTSAQGLAPRPDPRSCSGFERELLVRQSQQRPLQV